MGNFKKIYLFVVLLFLVPLLLFKIFSPNKTFAITIFGYVLGDEDEKEDEDKDEDSEDDEEDKEGKSDEDDEDGEQKSKDEEKETRTTRVNEDGTRTVTKRKFEDDGKVEIESKTYGVDGKVLEEYKSKSDTKKSEIEYKAKTSVGTNLKIAELKFKSKDGEEFKLMVKNGDGSITRVKYDENHNYIRIIGRPQEDNETEESEGIEDEIGDDVLVRANTDGTYELERHGKKALVKLPITIDDTDGSVLLLTNGGEKVLRNMPDVILSRVVKSDDAIQVSDVEINEKNGKVVYELTAEKAQKILGLFETRIHMLINYDAETAKELESVQGFWSSVLDAISF